MKTIWTAATFLSAMIFSLSSVYAEENPKSLFEALDTNKDGEVVASELSEKQKVHFNRLLQVADANQDGKLTQTEFVSGLTEPELKTLPSQRRGNRKRGGSSMTVDQLFKRFDKNKNGTLSKEEIPPPAQMRFEKLFEKLGKDELAKADVSAVIKRLNPDQKKKTNKGQQAKKLAQSSKVIFKRTDKNSDGVITIDEIEENKKANFKFADANNDGEVTPKELLSAMTKKGMAGNKKPAQNGKRPFFQKFDQDGDGAISKEEAPEKLKKNFSKVDADDDGKITQDEFSAFLKKRQQKGKGKKKKTS